MSSDVIQGLQNRPSCRWDEQRPAAENYCRLGMLLVESAELFLLAPERKLVILTDEGEQRVVSSATELDAVIKDRVDARKSDGKDIPRRDLATMLKSDIFLQCFRPADIVTRVPLYLPDWQLTEPGYNDGGEGQRIFYAGPPVRVADGLDAINAFLDVMDSKENADRTNAVALALTIRLRNFWPGAKPIGAITGNKSHCGKDTVRDFAVGTVGTREISWEVVDWPVEQTFEKATRSVEVGVVSLGNVRAGAKPITSAFIERFVTNPNPMITSTKTREARHYPNTIVLIMTANQGRLSADFMNRALPIRLETTGDVRERKTDIGNPREEFLPTHRDQIEAEFHGMIARWLEAGCPLDEDVRHPMSHWARTVGGILRANGFDDFLSNYESTVTEQEDEREALAILGSAVPDKWLRPGEWVDEARKQGLIRRLIPYIDRENLESQRRRIGQVLSAHEDETFEIATEEELIKLKLRKQRFRRDRGQEPCTCYKFEVIQRTNAPSLADEASSSDQETANAA